MPTPCFLQIPGRNPIVSSRRHGFNEVDFVSRGFSANPSKNPPGNMVTPLNRSISNSCVSVTGQSLNSLGTSFVKMSFPNSNDCYQGEFLICNNVLRPLQCILGWDFFIGNQLQLTFSENCYHIVGSHGKTPLAPLQPFSHSSQQYYPVASTLPVFTQSASQGPVNVVLAKDLSIPPRAECIVQGKIPKSCSNQLSMISILTDSSEVTYNVAYSVSQADRRTVPVRTMNSSSSAIEFHSGQKVAKFCPLVELASSNTYLPENASCSVVNKTLMSSQINSDLQTAISPRLSEGDKDKILQTLLEFSDVFHNSLGHTTVLEHHISTGNSPPIRQFPRQLPYHYRNEVSQQVQDMLLQGVIQPSTSPWASPLVLAKKKDGSY